MPTIEQMIELALKKHNNVAVREIKVDVPSGQFVVNFGSSAIHNLKLADAEAVVLEPKQEHVHDTAPCVLCEELYEMGVTAGKASLKPFDRDKLVRFIVDKGNGSATRLADAIADHFAAPQPKPWACTYDQAVSVLRLLMENISEDTALTNVPFRAVKDAVNHVLALDEISKAAWVHAAGDVLIDGLEDGSCNVLFVKGDDLGIVRVTEAQALATQAELDAADTVTDAEISRLSDKYVKGNTLFDNAEEIVRWVIEDYEAAKKARRA